MGHAEPADRAATASDALTTIPNVGPATAEDLHRLGIDAPADLVGEDPDALYERLTALDGRPHDVCTRDVFAAAIAYATDGTERPWWAYSRERKARREDPS